LSDELHAKVTEVLVELIAYNIMRLPHELQAERMRDGKPAAARPRKITAHPAPGWIGVHPVYPRRVWLIRVLFRVYPRLGAVRVRGASFSAAHA
jgi:hypothetical protein